MNHDKQSERDEATKMPDQKDCPECRLITPGRRRCGRCLDALICELSTDRNALKTSLDEALADAAKTRGKLLEDHEKWCPDFSVYCSDLRQERDEALAEIEKLKYVPGHFKCAKCDFYLVSKTLFMASASVGPNNEPQQCANGCGPMWRVSWEDHAKHGYQALEKMFERDEALARAKDQRQWGEELADRTVKECDRLRAENDRLRKSLSCVGVHTCFEGCEHPLCLMRKENERMNSDCTAMREVLEGSGYEYNCACPTLAEIVESHGQNYRCPYCIIGDVMLEPNPGSDLLAELKALRGFADTVRQVRIELHGTTHDLEGCRRALKLAFDELKDGKCTDSTST